MQGTRELRAEKQTHYPSPLSPVMESASRNQAKATTATTATTAPRMDPAPTRCVSAAPVAGRVVVELEVDVVGAAPAGGAVVVAGGAGIVLAADPDAGGGAAELLGPAGAPLPCGVTWIWPSENWLTGGAGAAEVGTGAAVTEAHGVVCAWTWPERSGQRSPVTRM